MGKIIVNNIPCHYGFKLLAKNYLAITLFGNVFFRMNKEELEKYVLTYAGKSTINHERIHLLQSLKLGNFKFYLYYLWFWFIGLFKYGGESYYNIPFEKEAYANEYNFNYNETKWEDYK